MIKPTIGRVVWYWPRKGEGIIGGDAPPLPAIICHVWGDRCVNLVVFDANGNAHGGHTSVPLHQDGDRFPRDGFCEWMPYQKDQAAKHDSQGESSLSSIGAGQKTMGFPQPAYINQGQCNQQALKAAQEAKPSLL